MEIEYRDKNLALIETDRAAEIRLPMSVIKSLGIKIRFLRSVPDERSLRNWKSLHYEKMEGDERSIRINKQYRLIFTIDTVSHPNKISILRVWDHD
jgi:proteic killer suppression protein